MIIKLLLLVIIPILTTTGQLFFKKGMMGLGNLSFSFATILSFIPRIFQSGWLLTGIFIFGVDFLFYLFVLSKLQLNILYPTMVSAGIIVLAVASWLLFKESLSLLQICGIIVIIFGIFLLMPRG